MSAAKSAALIVAFAISSCAPRRIDEGGMTVRQWLYDAPKYEFYKLPPPKPHMQKHPRPTHFHDA